MCGSAPAADRLTAITGTILGSRLDCEKSAVSLGCFSFFEFTGAAPPRIKHALDVFGRLCSSFRLTRRAAPVPRLTAKSRS